MSNLTKIDVLEKIGKTIKPFGKLLSVGFSDGEGDCWFNNKGVVCRYPTQFVQEALDYEIEARLSKEYFNKF